MYFRGLLVLVCAHLVLADQYSVPEPNIEAFSPKGLRISIPDAPHIKSVQFYMTFSRPMGITEPARVAKEIDDKQGSYWMFYHPGIEIKPGETVNYTITVNYNGQHFTRKGSQQVNKVLSTMETSIVDCEDEGQQHLIDFPDHEETHTAQNAEVKSAYSMFKSMETKPITRSTTTTTSGSFYVKPTGEVDGSGYRTASSYDSTRRDGEQWMHSKSELSASEIEALKRLHGQDFFTMPEFANLHGGASGSSGSSAYRQSSYSSSTSSQSQPLYGGSSSYHQIGQASEALPIVRPPASGFTTYSKFEKHESSSPTIVNPGYSSPTIVNPGYSSLTTSDSYKPAPSSFTFNSNNHEDYGETQSLLPVKPSYSSSSSVQSYKKETIKTAAPVITTYPSGGASTQVTKEQYEYKAPQNTVMVPVPLNTLPQVTYNGEIFRTSRRPTSPNSCAATDFSYKTASQIDVVALEHSLHELQCLAVLAENTMKVEIRALKEANTDLVSRLHDLSREFQKFRSECKCGY